MLPETSQDITADVPVGTLALTATTNLPYTDIDQD
jgi:hypothetical protein